jgi:hypothetical protein
MSHSVEGHRPGMALRPQASSLSIGLRSSSPSDNGMAHKVFGAQEGLVMATDQARG